MQNGTTKRPLPRRAFVRAFLALAAATILLMLLVAALVIQLNLIPQIVDFVRTLPFVGPERMAAIENAFYDIQDGWNEFAYSQTHAPVVVSQVQEEKVNKENKANYPEPTAMPADRSSIVTNAISGTATPSVGPLAQVAVSELPAPSLPLPMIPIILSDPLAGEGVWSTEDLPPSESASPPLWHTIYRPDPARPYAKVDLVRIDLRQTRLTLVPGTVEPRAVDGIRGEGKIPIDVQLSGKLLAAWNGGFLTIHGAYGMMVDRRIILPARDGFATLAQYTDGTVKLGVWGKDITMTPDLVSFRENGPMLVDHGVLNQDALLSWGKSISGETHIWRSGLGMAKDGTLLYAVGNSLSAQALGEALRLAGAVSAMQLDVNAWHVFFFTYELMEKGLAPRKLNAAIPGPNRVYLNTPHDRDFMYLTLK